MDYDMVGVTETWGSEEINDAEMSIKGFNMFRADRKGCRGGGVILYINEKIQATYNIQLMDKNFEQSIWCNVKLQHKTLIVGLCYRSTSSDVDNNEILLKLLDAATVHGYKSSILIMGDFNYPDIDYNTDSVQAGDMASSSRFFQKTQELCLHQHVQQPTRVRQGQQPSTLDYIFTNEDNIVQDILYSAPLGKSDHVVLEWNIMLSSVDCSSQQLKLNYWKGNYGEINKVLEELDWEQTFDSKSVEEMWLVFKSLLLNLVEHNVPIKDDRRKRKGKWLTKPTIKKMKEIRPGKTIEDSHQVEILKYIESSEMKPTVV